MGIMENMETFTEEGKNHLWFVYPNIVSANTGGVMFLPKQMAFIVAFHNL